MQKQDLFKMLFMEIVVGRQLLISVSATRLGNLLDFGQLFKDFVNN